MKEGNWWITPHAPRSKENLALLSRSLESLAYRMNNYFILDMYMCMCVCARVYVYAHAYAYAFVFNYICIQIYVFNLFIYSCYILIIACLLPPVLPQSTGPSLYLLRRQNQPPTPTPPSSLHPPPQLPVSTQLGTSSHCRTRRIPSH